MSVRKGIIIFNFLLGEGGGWGWYYLLNCYSVHVQYDYNKNYAGTAIILIGAI